MSATPPAPQPEERTPTVCVLALTPLLTIEIEPSGPHETSPEVHVHPGGQGLWLGRMAYSLGARVVVCGPFGGETGSVAAHLARVENLELRTTTSGGNGAYVHDRRRGEDPHRIGDGGGRARVVLRAARARPARVGPAGRRRPLRRPGPGPRRRAGGRAEDQPRGDGRRRLRAGRLRDGAARLGARDGRRRDA